MYGCVMDLHIQKDVLMFTTRENGVPFVTTVGTSMMPWSSVVNWDMYLP